MRCLIQDLPSRQPTVHFQATPIIRPQLAPSPPDL
jgi:hypothetical protein